MLTDSQAHALFAAFASRPALFAASRETLRQAAIDILAGQIKHKDCGLSMLREIRDAVGQGPLLAVLDELKTPAVVAIVKKLDKGNATKAAAETGWARQHLAELIEGKAEPLAAPAKKAPAPKKKSSPKPIVRTLHQAKSMGGG
jgi:hypothetical protein